LLNLKAETWTKCGKENYGKGAKACERMCNAKRKKNSR